MGPKKSSKELPKACADLKALLLQAGKSVTGENLSGKDIATLRNRGISAMKGHLKANDTEALSKYELLKSDIDRRNFLASYLIDPENASASCTNTTEKVTSNIDEKKGVWVTEDEYGGPMWLNNPAHAKIAVKGCQDRPHENPLLAAVGVKQYKVFKKTEVTSTGTIDKAKVKLDAAMTAEQYAETAQHMRASLASSSAGGSADGAPNGKRRKTATQEPPTAQQKERKEAKEKYDKAVKSMKSTVDRVRKELNDVTLIQKKLEAKSWGAGATDFLKSEAAAQQATIEDLFDAYGEAKDVDTTAMSISEISARAVQMEAKVTKACDQYKSFARDVLGQFSKMK